LNAGETVDMPVFFFIDPDFVKDPAMKGIDTITLSYTFFSKSPSSWMREVCQDADGHAQKQNTKRMASYLPYQWQWPEGKEVKHQRATEGTPEHFSTWNIQL
jgi:hypothetical protein